MFKFKQTRTLRCHVLKWRATDAEREQVSELAFAAGISVSALLRALLKGQPIRRRRSLPKTDPELIRALVRIGVSLSQIAKGANAHLCAIPAAAVIIRLVTIERLHRGTQSLGAGTIQWYDAYRKERAEADIYQCF